MRQMRICCNALDPPFGEQHVIRRPTGSVERATVGESLVVIRKALR
jgi:hypothetical protein